MQAAHHAAPTQAFERARRYLLCDQCGAPVEIAKDAGSASCGYCRAPVEVRMRSEAAAVPPRARSESERLEILAGQERRYLPPQDIASLFIGERIAPTLEAQARAQWQSLRNHLRQHADPASAQRLVALSIGLAELAFDRGDLVGQRALVDSALAVTPEAKHQQVMRAQLTRSALKAGDMAAAEAWLATCDPKSEDLLADTAYRFASAYLATARRDYRGVVAVLGAGADIPLSHAYAPECAVLCANAWERMDQRAVAVDALTSVKRDLGPLGRRRTQRFIAAHASWQLCPKSEPEAERRIGDLDPLPVEGGALAALLLLVMGVFSLLWAGSGIAMPIVMALLDLGQDDSALGFSLSIMSGGALGVLLTPIGLLLLIAAWKQSRQRKRGKACAAHVLEQTRIGDRQSESITLKLNLLITPDDAPAYYSSIETSIIEVMRGNFDPGKLLVARVSGSNPHDYALEILG